MKYLKRVEMYSLIVRFKILIFCTIDYILTIFNELKIISPSFLNLSSYWNRCIQLRYF